MTKCICCNNKDVNSINTKYCSSCSFYVKRLHQEISYLKLKIRKLNYLIYGKKNPNRLPNDLRGGEFSPANKLAFERGYEEATNKMLEEEIEFLKETPKLESKDK